jgi:hypothetical protein
LSVAALLLGSAAASAQTVPQVPDRSQSQLRLRFSRDCKQEGRNIREQYRIQQEVLQRQYAVDSVQSAGDAAAVQRLRHELDARIAILRADADNFAARIERQCRDDNRATLRNNDELGRR